MTKISNLASVSGHTLKSTRCSPLPSNVWFNYFTFQHHSIAELLPGDRYKTLANKSGIAPVWLFVIHAHYPELIIRKRALTIAIFDISSLDECPPRPKVINFFLPGDLENKNARKLGLEMLDIISGFDVPKMTKSSAFWVPNCNVDFVAGASCVVEF